jgi:hypothetical protein
MRPAPHGRGGIGRRSRFRSCHREMWGFESLRPRQGSRPVAQWLEPAAHDGSVAVQILPGPPTGKLYSPLGGCPTHKHLICLGSRLLARSGNRERGFPTHRRPRRPDQMSRGPPSRWRGRPCYLLDRPRHMIANAMSAAYPRDLCRLSLPSIDNCDQSPAFRLKNAG